METETITALLVFISLMLTLGTGTKIAELKQERKNHRLKKEQKGQPICGCGHHHAYHEPTTNHCRREIKHETQWDEWGDPTAYKYVNCDCQTYSGPPQLENMDLYNELMKPHNPKQIPNDQA